MAHLRTARTVDELIEDMKKGKKKENRPVWLLWSGVGAALLCVLLAVVFWPRTPRAVAPPPLSDEQKKKMLEEQKWMQGIQKQGKVTPPPSK